jgi:hypothetical protein
VTAEIALNTDALCAEKAADVIIESASAEPEYGRKTIRSNKGLIAN